MWMALKVVLFLKDRYVWYADKTPGFKVKLSLIYFKLALQTWTLPPTQHLFVQSKQWKHQNNARNLFKVHSSDIRRRRSYVFGNVQEYYEKQIITENPRTKNWWLSPWTLFIKGQYFFCCIYNRKFLESNFLAYLKYINVRDEFCSIIFMK